jgi:2-oxoglutarate ferredoxin oxidoreductase subunit alpha
MDLDIGMNDWMCKRLTWDDSYRPDRGKVLDKAALEKVEKFFRYVSTNGDGVAARTLPGVDPKGSYFTRGSGHTKFGTYTEDADEYREVMDRLVRKIAAAAEAVPAPEICDDDGASVGVITIGSCRGAVLEALDRLKEQGMELDFMRVRGFPFGKAGARVPRTPRQVHRHRAEPRWTTAVAAHPRDRNRARAVAVAARIRRVAVRHQPGH